MAQVFLVRHTFSPTREDITTRTKVPDGTNYRDIKLNTGRSAHNEIAIVYGTLPSAIPKSYNGYLQGE